MWTREKVAEEVFFTLAGLARLPFLLLRCSIAVCWRVGCSYRARNWRLFSARVESVSVSVRRTCLTRAWTVEFADAELAYSYEISGERFSGYSRRHFFDEQAAWTYADQWKGRQVMIRCDQRNPARSVLRSEDQFGALCIGA